LLQQYPSGRLLGEMLMREQNAQNAKISSRKTLLRLQLCEEVFRSLTRLQVYHNFLFWGGAVLVSEREGEYPLW
jgi:hypothetical protein